MSADLPNTATLCAFPVNNGPKGTDHLAMDSTNHSTPPQPTQPEPTQSEPTPYDTVTYPSIVHPPTHPERLAVAARLAGLDPVPMNAARVLEIGGGTCLGLIAFAATYPGSQCAGFDLAPSAIARGRQLAGDQCPNLSLDVIDILEARSHYAAQSFDYVIAHGVYAWVPEPVRQALLDLIAHVLSPRGVAFVSYNAMPGGHVRLILREMLLHALAGIDDPQDRISAAFAALHEYGTPRADDDPLVAGIRMQAANMADRPASVLFHDELGGTYTPHKLTDVVGAAAQVGLRFLTDGGRNRGFDGFLNRDSGAVADAEAEVVQLAQMRDYLEFCWFRATLLVRAEVRPERQLDPALLDGLWVSAQLAVLESGEFKTGDDCFTVADAAMTEAMEELANAWPARRPVSDIARTDAQRQILLGLYEKWLVRLHLEPEPFALVPGERPETAGWIRYLLREGEDEIVTLAYRNMRIEQADLRELLVAADGTRSVADLVAFKHWGGSDGGPSGGIAADQVEAALREAGKRALLVR